MSDFKPINRTVVTEIKTFLVDSVARSASFRQSVSSRVPDGKALNRQDFNVSDTQSFEFGDVDKIIGILSPEPVLIEFQQAFVPVIDVPVVPEIETLLSVPETVVQDDSIDVILVTDSVAPQADSVEVVAFNTATGETDYVYMVRLNDTLFTGTLNTLSSIIKGADFDQEINVLHGHVIEFTYSIMVNEEEQTVAASTTIESLLASVKTIVPHYTFTGKPLAIQVTSTREGADHLFVTVINTASTEIETVRLDEARPGIFQGTLSTVVGTSFISEDGQMSINPGEAIRVAYTDNPVLETEDTSANTMIVSPRGITGVFDCPVSAPMNEEFEILLYDYNLSGAAHVDIPVSKPGAPVELLRLLEVSPYLGIFKCRLKFVTEETPSPTTTNLVINPNDAIILTYFDTESEFGEVKKVECSTTALFVEPISAPVVADLGTDESTDMHTGSVSFYVDGLFYLNGAFKGKAIVKGLNELSTRCELLYV